MYFKSDSIKSEYESSDPDQTVGDYYLITFGNKQNISQDQRVHILSLYFKFDLVKSEYESSDRHQTVEIFDCRRARFIINLFEFRYLNKSNKKLSNDDNLHELSS